MEDRMTHNDLLHEELLRLGNNKRLALDKVCVCVHACICVWVRDNLTLSLSLALSFPHRAKQVPKRRELHSMRSYDQQCTNYCRYLHRVHLEHFLLPQLTSHAMNTAAIFILCGNCTPEIFIICVGLLH